MFYGLIEKGSEISDSLHKFVAIAPCSVAAKPGYDLKETLFKVEGLGVYAFYNTPTWDRDLITICD